MGPAHCVIFTITHFKKQGFEKPVDISSGYKSHLSVLQPKDPSFKNFQVYKTCTVPDLAPSSCQWVDHNILPQTHHFVWNSLKFEANLKEHHAK